MEHRTYIVDDRDRDIHKRDALHSLHSHFIS